MIGIIDSFVPLYHISSANTALYIYTSAIQSYLPIKIYFFLSFTNTPCVLVIPQYNWSILSHFPPVSIYRAG